MTAIAQERSISTFAPLNFLPLLLAVLLLVGYVALPWINQPELGPTPAPTILAERDANEMGIPREGLAVTPIAGIIAVGLGLWNIVQPKHSRAIAAALVLCGVTALVYLGIFTLESSEIEVNIWNYMGAGFWLVQVAALAMIVQMFIPRQMYEGFELNRVFGNQETVLGLAIVVLLVIVGLSSPRFLAERNLSDILQGNAYIAVAAIGISMVIISGNIDISVGSLIGLLAAVSGNIVVAGTSMTIMDDGSRLFLAGPLTILLAWVAPLVLGGLVGAFNGFLVAYLRIPSIVVTLGMLSILKGILIIWTQGERITDMPDAYLLAQMRPLGIPTPILLMVGLTIIAALWLRYSGLGRSIYAVGGNPEAARLSGISERRVVFTVFVINGVFAGIASLMYATQLNIIQVTPPPALELTIISASVVGGVSILGGTGTVIGSTLAAVLLNMIRSAMVFINVSPFWIQAVQGVLILGTVLADLFRRRRQRIG